MVVVVGVGVAVSIAPPGASDFEGNALREALEALVGLEATWIVGGPPPTFEETLADYSNAQLADAVGYPKGPKGSAAWTARRSFMRTLQRYRNVGTAKQARRPPIEGRIRRQVEAAGIKLAQREQTPDELAGVLSLIRRHGLTVTLFVGWVKVSQDLSHRAVHDVFCAPGRLRSSGFFEAAGDGDWPGAFEALWPVFCESYGVAFELHVLEALEIEIGRQTGRMGGRRVA